MRRLYYHPAVASSRLARLVLAERDLPAEAVIEKPWERRPEFMAINVACEVPVLEDLDGTVVSGAMPIVEFLEESHPGHSTLLGATTVERAETRRLIAWFESKFAREVSDLLVGEKLIRRLRGDGVPHAQSLRAGALNIHYHLDYIGWLADRRRWLAGERMTAADLAAAAQLSVLDYLGDVPWDQHQGARNWYARIKSRPSFRPLLAETLPGVPAAPHYVDLDF